MTAPSEATPVKRGPGRPRKNAPAETAPDAPKADATPAAELAPDAAPPKRTRRRRTPKPGNEKGAEMMLGMVIGSLYALPAYTMDSPIGDHWPLDDDEKQAVASAVSEAIDAMPSAKAKAFKKLLAQYAPLVNVGIVLAAVTTPRVVLTRRLIEEARTREAVSRNGGRPLQVVREEPAPRPASVPEPEAEEVEA